MQGITEHYILRIGSMANKTGYMPDGLEEALARVDQLLDRMIAS